MWPGRGREAECVPQVRAFRQGLWSEHFGPALPASWQDPESGACIASVRAKGGATGSISDDRVALSLADGTTREGWISEVLEDAIVFEHAPSPFYAQATGTDEMAPPPERIAIDQITGYVGAEPGWCYFEREA